MKKYIKSIILPVIILLFLLPGSIGAREIEPIIHSDRLEANLANPNLIILDIRHMEEYREGHMYDGAMQEWMQDPSRPTER